MHLSFFLAWRYLRACHNTPIKTMLWLSFCTITIASCALAMVTFIMQGFEQSTHKALKGMHADLIMRSRDNFINFSCVKKVLDTEFPEISAASPSAMYQALLGSHDSPTPQAIMIKAVDPQHEQKTTDFSAMILSTKNKFSDLLTENNVVIGYKLARALNVNSGDELELFIPAEEQLQRNTLHFTTHKIKLAALFKTGIEEFDSNFIIASFSMLENIIAECGVSHIHLNHNQKIDETALIASLKNRFGLHVYSWKQLYPALVAALRLEKYTMIFVISIMVLLACMSIIALLFMIITTKQKDQAILRAMGLSRNKCSLIFMIIGMIISSTASIFGLFIACLLSFIIQKYQLIKLPDAYYVSHLPMVMYPENVLYIFLVIVLVTFLITLVPFMQNRNITISSLLKL